MSHRLTKCTVCGQSGHTRIHCLVMCGSCSGDSRKCDCEQPPAKEQKTKKGRRATEKEQLQVAAGSPEAEPNYKSICRQLQQKNQQLGKAYQDLKAQFDELEDQYQEREEQLAQAQQDADEMADLVRQNEQEMATYKEQMKALRPWSSGCEPCRTQNHQLQQTMKVLRRSTAMTLLKSIADTLQCSPL